MTRLDETIPKKRLTLSLRLPSSSSPDAYSPTMPIFNYFLRLPDTLASSAHFRPEVQRRLDSEKKKKEMRDNRLKGMSAEEQRKFLEREREKGQKKQEKKMSRKA